MKDNLLKIKILKFLVDRKLQAAPKGVSFYKKTLHKYTKISLGELDLLTDDMSNNDKSIVKQLDPFDEWKVWATDVGVHFLKSNFYLNLTQAAANIPTNTPTPKQIKQRPIVTILKNYWWLLLIPLIIGIILLLIEYGYIQPYFSHRSTK